MKTKVTFLILMSMMAWASLSSAGDVVLQSGATGHGGQYVPQSDRADVEIWCQEPAFISGASSQEDTAYPFESWVADDFTSPGDEAVQSVQWWGLLFGSATPAQPSAFIISFYTHDGSCDPGVPPTPVYEYYAAAYTLADLGNGYFEYNADIPPMLMDAGVTYWISIQSVQFYNPTGQWGWDATATPYGCTSSQLFPLLGTTEWTALADGDRAFCLYFDDSMPVADEATSFSGVKKLFR